MSSLPSYVTGFFAVLLLSSFAKILVSLNVLRFGIGLKGGGFGLVIVGAALSLSLLVMAPQIKAAGGLQNLLLEQDPSRIETWFRPFLEKNTHKDILQKFSSLRTKLEGAGAPAQADEVVPVTVLAPAFMMSELTEAFQIGFILLVPFLVIDLIVANILMVLGMTHVTQAAVAMPLKILVFFAVDGWALLSEKLVMGYIS